jgi:hypothetical protein
MGIIYLLKTREFVNLNQNIFKIGKSSKPGATRINQYPNGSVLYFLITVVNEDLIERKIIDLFSTEFIHKKEYGNEYFEGDYTKMVEKIFLIIQSGIDFDVYENEYFNEEQNICELKTTLNGNRTHYIEFKDGSTFLCETSNGFIKKLLDKGIIEVNKPFNILDSKLLNKVNREKNRIHIQHFDVFCYVYGEKCISDDVENFFDDTVINDTFYGLSLDIFTKRTFKNFELRSYYTNIGKRAQNDRYEKYDGCHNNSYADIKIVCINEKLFCANLFYRYIPKELTIYEDTYIYQAREYNYIGIDYKDVPEIKQKSFHENLYESGKYPWSSKELYNIYIEKIKEVYKIYSLSDKKCLNPENNIFYTFISLI